MDIKVRKAVPGDSAVLAELMNIAGDGIPARLWAGMAAPGEDVMAFGARRVARDEGGFSYRNVHVAVVAVAVVGMLLGYRLPEADEAAPLGDCPAVVRPLLELEALVGGAWYINAVATVAACRGRGVGSRLLRLAESMAWESGAAAIALIVAEENRGALTLYEKLGYEVIARRPVVPYLGCPHAGDYVLMRKACQ